MAEEELLVEQMRKGKKRVLNIRPMFTACEIASDDTLLMRIVSASGAASIKPVEALQHIFGLDEQTVAATIITKTGWRDIEEK